MNTTNIANRSQILIWYNENGTSKVGVMLDNNDLWLNQKQISEVFMVSRVTITEHIQDIYNRGELDIQTTCRDFRQVQQEGTRQVSRGVQYYNLDMIISVGYRVNSSQAISFRTWATSILKSYLQANQGTKK